jgi:MYXO-CTERM domain-containing protein
MPAEAAAEYQGAAMTYRTCSGDPAQGCALEGHAQLYFRTWVKLDADHQYVHHFLSVAGTQPDEYWGADGNAGCRPNGYRAAGTTLDFNENRELFFYTYFPEMNCDSGGYCSGQYVQDICDGCASKDMPCTNGLECCWGNHFGPEPPLVLPRDEWVCLEIMMQLNTPGETDGVMAFWMNDELGHEQTGMRWRDDPNLQLNKAWLQHYIASGDADQSNRVSFDDVVVSTERIGCGGDPPGGDDSESGTGGDDGPSGNDDGGGDGGTSGPGTTGAGSSTSGDPSGTSGATDGAPAEDGGDGGCGCRTHGRAGAAWWLLGLVGLVRGRQRRASAATVRTPPAWRRTASRLDLAFAASANAGRPRLSHLRRAGVGGSPRGACAGREARLGPSDDRPPPSIG